MNLKDILTETIKTSELHTVTTNLTEVVLDGVLDDGLIKDIPFVSSIYAITKGVMSISDRLLINKLLKFIYEIKDLSPLERNEQIIKIQTSSKYQSTIGEKILFAIDKANDSEKASLIGKMFLHCLKNEISYSDFIRCSEIINNIDIVLLKEVINHDYTEIPIDQEDDLISSGFFALKPPKIEIKKFENTYQHMRDGEDLKTDYKIDSMDWSAKITKHGKLIRVLLNNY